MERIGCSGKEKYQRQRDPSSGPTDAPEASPRPPPLAPSSPSAALLGAPLATTEAKAAEVGDPVPTSDPELLETLSLGVSFSSDSVLKLLAEREAAHAATFTAVVGSSSTSYVQQLSCTVLSPSLNNGDGGVDSVFFLTGGVVEMLSISQPLYEMAVRGTGGKALDEEAALKKAFCRCPWWTISDPSAFAKHVKGKVMSQEFTQVCM